MIYNVVYNQNLCTFSALNMTLIINIHPKKLLETEKIQISATSMLYFSESADF